MSDRIEIGLEGEARTIVHEGNTAIALESGSVPVFATPAMIALMEKAALSSVEPFLGADRTTVGTRVEARHLGATPLGMTVVARSRLVEIDGNRLLFEAEARDERETIGTARHERVIVQKDRFLERAFQKGRKG